MHAGMSRRLVRGTGGRRAVMARDLGEEVRIEVVRFRGWMEFDDAEDRAVGRRRNADLAGGGVGLARDIGGCRVRDPEVEHFDAQLGFAAGLGRDIVEPDNRLAARVVGGDYASDIIRCRHKNASPLSLPRRTSRPLGRARAGAREERITAEPCSDKPRATAAVCAPAMRAPPCFQPRLLLRALCVVGKEGLQAQLDKIGSGREPNKKPRRSPRKTLKAQMLKSGTI